MECYLEGVDEPVVLTAEMQRSGLQRGDYHSDKPTVLYGRADNTYTFKRNRDA